MEGVEEGNSSGLCSVQAGSSAWPHLKGLH